MTRNNGPTAPMPTVQPTVKELDYIEYQNRQYEEISYQGLVSRAERLGIGRRAKWQDGRWAPLPYPGYALQAMLGFSSNREALCLDLQELQQRVTRLVERPGALYPLPPASFHQTVANTFSGERRQHCLLDTGLDESFPALIGGHLSDWKATEKESPVVMRLIGIGLFRTALGLLGIFEDPTHFRRVTAFRDRVYGDRELSAIGLKRTRPFIGHVTLAYLEDHLDGREKLSLVEGIDLINQSLRQRRLYFEMPKAELRRYDNLSDFQAVSGYPSFKI